MEEGIEPGLKVRHTVARVPSRAGMAWVRQAWTVFKAAAIPWSGMTAAAFLAIMLASQIPWLGKYLVELLSPLLVAGFMSASRAAGEGQPVTFLHLGAGFRTARIPLLVVGGVYLLGVLLIDQVMLALGGQGFQDLLTLARQPRDLSPEEAQAMLGAALPALLLGMLLFTPLLMATWFAPALILFAGFRPGTALWWSLWACGVNWRPLLVYTSLLGLAALPALLIPFGLGLLVFMPWAMISTYAAYRGMFVPIEKTES